MWVSADQGIEMWQCEHGNLFSTEEDADNCGCYDGSDDCGNDLDDDDYYDDDDGENTDDDHNFYCGDPDCPDCS
jgi:hypothetical protein